MMNFLVFVMLHYGTDLRVCIVQGFIDRLLQEILLCGWRHYSSVFNNAVITMPETGNSAYLLVFLRIASPLQGLQRQRRDSVIAKITIFVTAGEARQEVIQKMILKF